MTEQNRANNTPQDSRQKPLALVVFLENVGHIQGIPLPQWAQNVIDFVTEEYAKLLLRLYGAYRRYRRVIILEDREATGPPQPSSGTTLPATAAIRRRASGDTCAG